MSDKIQVTAPMNGYEIVELQDRIVKGAHTRDDVPRLVATIEAMQDALSALSEEIERLNQQTMATIAKEFEKIDPNPLEARVARLENQMRELRGRFEKC